MDLKVFHRFDDIGTYDEGVIRLLNTLEKSRIPSIVAIIPNNLDKQMETFIKSLKYPIIVQHGVKHINRVKSGWLDEFPEFMDKVKVEKQLYESKLILESRLDCNINTYVPPWNNTSNKTIRILENIGFDVFSSQHNKMVSTKMNQYPIHIDVTKTYAPEVILKSYSEVIGEIINLRHYSIPIGIMYHPNNLCNNDIEKIIRWIMELKDEAVSYEQLKAIFNM